MTAFITLSLILILAVTIVRWVAAVPLLHTRWSNANGMLAVSMFKNSL